MSFESEEYGSATNKVEDGKKRLPTGLFVGRDEEQARFREMLGGLNGARRGLLGGLLGSSRPTSVIQPIQSRVIVIEGEAGSGKTRLAGRLREIVQKEKEWSGRFKTLWLNWPELLERDGRFNSRWPGEPLPADALLDVLHNHFVRENAAGHFEEYRQAIEDTRQLAQTVQDAELAAVWEFRGRALGRGLKSWSGERPLLFIMDDFQAVQAAGPLIFTPMMEESGPQLIFCLVSTGLQPSDLEIQVAPARFARFQPAPFNEADLRRFYDLELARYAVARADEVEFSPIYRSPDMIARLSEITSGIPLAARLSAFLLQTGLSVADLPQPTSSGGLSAVMALADAFISGPLGPGHPDRLRLYSLAILRRPEQGLLGAMFDARQDMLSVDEMLDRLNDRYSFLFEPGRAMTLHVGLIGPLRHYLLDPARRYEANGLAKVSDRALDYLDTRLSEWGVNFPRLADRAADLKWREWALDRVWHAFWYGEERGWPHALALLVVGLGLRPQLSRQVVAVLSSLDSFGLLNEGGQRRLNLFRRVATDPASAQAELRELALMGQEGDFFRQAMPDFATDLSNIINRLA